MGRLLVKRSRSAFPIKCPTCLHTNNITSGKCTLYQFNLVLHSFSLLGLTPAFYMGEEEPCPELGQPKPVAMDCEMVGVGPKLLNALGRVSIIDYDGLILYDVMVRPEEEITDYRTRWSGIRPDDMRRAIPFDCAQEQVKRILQNRIVIGHMVHHDFSVLRLKHPPHMTRDTAKAPYAKIMAGFPHNKVVGLRALTIRLFGVQIQTNEHCSTEDARATMAIYRLVESVWESNLHLKTPQIPISTNHTLEQPDSDVESPDSTIVNDVLNRSCPVPIRLKRPLSSNVASSPDLLEIARSKRRSTTTLIGSTSDPSVDALSKSASCFSLLDDSFWPEGCLP